MRRLMFPALLALAVAAGCAGTASGGYYASASYSTPDLVYVSPGVQVIADYDEPIFYSNGFYWRYYGDTWYRSNTYTGGWIYARPPAAVLRIDRPYAYRRYRPSGYVTRRDRQYDHRPVYRDNRPVYRDNRPVYRDNRPVVRDHRDYRTAPRQAPVYRDQRAAPQRVVPRGEVRRRDSRDVQRDRDRARDAREQRRRDRR